MEDSAMINPHIVELEHRKNKNFAQSVVKNLDWNKSAVKQIVDIIKFKTSNMKTMDEMFHAALREAYDFASKDIRTPFAENEKTINLFRSIENGSFHMTMHQELAFRKNGSKIYEVSDGLALELYHTELKGVMTDDLRLPFPGLYFVAPEIFNFPMYTRSGGESILDGIYFSEIPPAVALPEIDGELANGELTDTPRTWMLAFMSRNNQKGNLPNAQTFQVPIALTENTSIDEILNGAIYGKTHAFKNAHLKMRELWPKIFRFFMNAIIYATNSEPAALIERNPEAANLWQKIERMPQSRKRSNLEGKHQSLSSKHLLLGAAIPIDRQLQSQQASGTGRGTPLSVRVKVSGHWRKQVCGRGRLERRLTWIKPFWRGIENKEISNRNHVLI